MPFIFSFLFAGDYLPGKQFIECSDFRQSKIETSESWIGPRLKELEREVEEILERETLGSRERERMERAGDVLLCMEKKLFLMDYKCKSREGLCALPSPGVAYTYLSPRDWNIVVFCERTPMGVEREKRGPRTRELQSFDSVMVHEISHKCGTSDERVSWEKRAQTYEKWLMRGPCSRKAATPKWRCGSKEYRSKKKWSRPPTPRREVPGKF